MNRDLAWNNYKCPYTDDKCDKESCEGCEVEERERKWVDEIDEGENDNE